MPGQFSRQLLERVRRRLYVASIGGAFLRSLIGLTVVYAVVVAAARLTGVWPTVFTPWTYLAVPALALVVALAWHRRPAMTEAAHLVDRHTGSKDLFLTLAHLETSSGAYQPLIVEMAEEKAPGVASAQVVPWQWRRRYWAAVGLPALVIAEVLLLPAFDPFGLQAVAEVKKERENRLVESRRLTELRREELKKAEELAESDVAEKAIEDLKLTYGQMDPQKKDENLKQLIREQKQVGELWRKMNAEKLTKAFERQAAQQQQMGGEEPEQEMLRKATQDLQQTGSSEALRKEMQKIAEELKTLSKTKDPVEQAEKKQELKKKMEQLEKLASQQLGSPQLAAALERARQQMELSQQQDLSQEALKAALESLELSEKELEEVAQSLKDLKDLEQALKTLQQAKKLNEFEKLDGGQCKNCKSLSDYEALYKEMLAQCQGNGEGEGDGRGDGQGMGGPGTGQGGKAPEDDSVETGFKTEKSQSAVTAGKILLSIKGKGVGESGDVADNYQGLIQSVKQGVAEAIQQEQVPPGYHEGIKSYFDSLKPGEEPAPPK